MEIYWIFVDSRLRVCELVKRRIAYYFFAVTVSVIALLFFRDLYRDRVRVEPFVVESCGEKGAQPKKEEGAIEFWLVVPITFSLAIQYGPYLYRHKPLLTSIGYSLLPLILHSTHAIMAVWPCAGEHLWIGRWSYLAVTWDGWAGAWPIPLLV